MTALPIPADPFGSLDDYIAIPRLAAQAMSPDGSELLLSVLTLNEARTAHRTSLWTVPTDGSAGPERLETPGLAVGSARYAGTGDVVVLARPEDTGPEDRPQVYRLGPDGKSQQLSFMRTGVDGILDVHGSTLLLQTTVPSYPAGADRDGVDEARRERAAMGVQALLHDSYPVRELCVDVQPEETRLLVLDLDAPDGAEPEALTVGEEVRPLVNFPFTARFHAAGARVAIAMNAGGHTEHHRPLVDVDRAGGALRTLYERPGRQASPWDVSPDGSLLLFGLNETDGPTANQAWVCRPDGSGLRMITGGVDEAWIGEAWFSADGRSVLVGAAQDNGHPVWSIELESGATRRVTQDEGCYFGIAVDPGGEYAYAIRNSMLEPAHPVRIRLADGHVDRLPTPTPPVPLPGRATIARTPVAVAGQDEPAEVSGWLVLPEGASPENPAPLLTFFHGGTLGMWGSWVWGWNPWPAVRRGYAVVLPNSAMSTGFGTAHAHRGWGRWGAEPYTEMLALVDAVVARPEIDAERTALLGCSYGGYITNWAATQTDRFRAIVTVSGMWDLPALFSQMDMSPEAQAWMTEEQRVEFSPHRYADNVRTPMLIVHGDKDFRLPVAQVLAQWSDLLRRVPDDEPVPHKLLLFPDEHHVVLKPQNTKVWLQTVLAFLDTHVRGLPWATPKLLL